MTALLATIKKELLLLTHDMHGLLLLFAMPVIFILIMSLALQNQFSGGEARKIHVLLDAQPASDATSRVIKTLQTYDNFTWRIEEKNRAQDTLHKDKAAFLLTLQEQDDTLTANVLVAPGTNAQTEAIFTAIVNQAVMRERVESLLRKIKMREALRQDFTTSDNTNSPAFANSSTFNNGLPNNVALDNHLPDIDQLSRNAVQVQYSFRSQQHHQQPSSVQQNVPAWLVFAMFFSVVPLANTLISERQQGTLRRLRTLPISPALPIIGKLLPYFVINQIQVALMLMVGVFLMPLLGAESLTLGHSPAGLLVMSCSLSIAALGYGILIAVIAHTTEQASILGGIGNILLGAIGGIMVPRFVMPETMQQLANLSPMCWGLEGFLDIFLRNASVIDVLPEAGSLILFGGITITLAMYLHRTKPT